MDDLVYRKYEQWSHVYLLSLDQINTLLQKNQSLNDAQIDQLLMEQSFWIITTALMPNFLVTMQHNIALAQKTKNYGYLVYLQHKLKIPQDLSTVDSMTWQYQPVKLSLKLKIKNAMYQADEILSALLKIPKTQYRYRSDLIRLVHQYIRQHHLQDTNPAMCQLIHPDQGLSQVLHNLEPTDAEYTYYNLSHYLGQHIICVI